MLARLQFFSKNCSLLFYVFSSCEPGKKYVK